MMMAPCVPPQFGGRLRERGVLLSGGVFYDEHGAKLPFGIPFDHEGNLAAHGHTPVMVHWADIRRVLYEALPAGAAHGMVGTTGTVSCTCADAGRCGYCLLLLCVLPCCGAGHWLACARARLQLCHCW